MEQSILNEIVPTDTWHPMPSWIRAEEENTEQTKFIESFKEKRRKGVEVEQPAKEHPESEKKEPKE
jgi:hypothetical protein